MTLTVISHKEYRERLKVYVSEEKEKFVRKPEGFFSNMGFYNIKEQEFRKILANQGIEIEK